MKCIRVTVARRYFWTSSPSRMDRVALTPSENRSQGVITSCGRSENVNTRINGRNRAGDKRRIGIVAEDVCEGDDVELLRGARGFYTRVICKCLVLTAQRK